MKKLIPPVAICLFLLTGCIVGVKFFLYNNAGSPIQVHGCGHDKTILAGKQEKITVCDELRISFAGQTFKYFDFIPMPRDDREFEPYYGYGIGRIGLYAQLNKDGKIFIVKEDTRLPVSDFDRQPTGFPITGEK